MKRRALSRRSWFCGGRCTAAASTGLDPGIADDALKRLGDIANGIAAAQALTTGLERFLPQFAGLLSKLQATDSFGTLICEP